MMVFVWFVAALLGMAAAAWVFRFAGQSATNNAPRFRDMPFGVAFGYVLAVVLLAILAKYYLDPRAFFFRWFLHIALILAAASWVFRLAGRSVGPHSTRRLFRSMPLTAAFGVFVVLLYAFVAIFAGFLAPHGEEQIFAQANVPMGGNPLSGGDPAFPLGTDQIGRDILSRLIYGAQNTVGIAFVTTCIAFFLGGSLGFLAATLGGWTDQILSRLVDVLMAIPSLIFALLLMTIAAVWAPILGISLTVFMVLIIAVIDSTRVYRLARAVGQNIVVMDYIEAAKLRGEGMGYLVFREILPNAMAPLLAEFGLRFCFVFLTIAALSFLGVGIQPPAADWGTMVRDLNPFIQYASIVPVAETDEQAKAFALVAAAPLLAAGAIALLTIAVNFVVDWMLHRTSGLKE